MHMKKKTEESLGSSMIFELCDYVKEQITDINDGVVGAIKMVD